MLMLLEDVGFQDQSWAAYGGLEPLRPSCPPDHELADAKAVADKSYHLPQSLRHETDIA